ncbi:MAG: 4Fe-4S dicluster domain-containing protein [Spirochaetes bacterium]|nr:4Fe-4S dicluster domain-containing protein [Spirochaetota bacterium]
MKGKTKISIDYARCGESGRVDPRTCGICLRVCGPAVFLLHQPLGAVEENPYKPRQWRVTAVHLSLCTRCMKCVELCPEKAVTVTW